MSSSFFNRHVTGLDIDAESLEIASANADDLEVIILMVLLLIWRVMECESICLVNIICTFLVLWTSIPWPFCTVRSLNSWLMMLFSIVYLLHLQLEMDFVQCDVRNFGWRGTSLLLSLSSIELICSCSCFRAHPTSNLSNYMRLSFLLGYNQIKVPSDQLSYKILMVLQIY